jgi:hypothetical protein
MVAEFVGNLQHDLSQNKQTELQGIGIFRYNAEQKIEFEYLEAENYLSHSFGLPELVSRPVIPEEAAALRAVRQKIKETKEPVGKKGFAAKSKKYATVAATVLTGGLTVAMVYYVSLQTDYNLSSLNPVALFTQEAGKTLSVTQEKPADDAFENLEVTPESESVSAVEADQPVAEAEEAVWEESVPEKAEIANQAPEANLVENAMVSAPKTAGPAKEVVKVAVVKNTPALVKTEAKKEAVISAGSTIKAETGRYFVISGGFSTLANAERSQQDLTAKGAATNIILPMKGSKLHRVSVADFENMELAAAKLPELRKKYGNALWILNY